MPQKVMLKKYASRRLYDTGQSAYVTLTQVADMIREGLQVEVVDAKTKEDVTAFILTQIVLEEAKNKNALLPPPLLHLIIRYGGTVLNEFFEKYLQQILRNYLNYKDVVDDQFSKWIDLGMDISGMAQKSMGGLTPFNPFFGMPSGSKEESGNKNEPGSGSKE